MTAHVQSGSAVGIDGYHGGWVAACLTDSVIGWRTCRVEHIGDLCPFDVVVGVDMPIGLLDRGERACDALARRALPGAGSRVFTTPPRGVLALGPTAPNDAAQARSRELMGKGVSRQALALGPRILALDAHLAERHDLDDVPRVIEVHPELSFAQMTGAVLASKKTADGVRQRLDAHATWLPDPRRLVERRPPDVPMDDALDALAALWSAIRWRDGLARTLPPETTVPPFIAV
jgi:predicted RNase H-like nuclease